MNQSKYYCGTNIGNIENFLWIFVFSKQPCVQTHAKNNFFSNWGHQNKGKKTSQMADLRNMISNELIADPGTDWSSRGYSEIRNLGRIYFVLFNVLKHMVRMIASILLLTSFCVDYSHASLGETEQSVVDHSNRLGLKRELSTTVLYRVHEVVAADGSKIREFVNLNGIVFAIRWNTHAKPDLKLLLGTSFPGYLLAAQDRARTGGVQRHFIHQQADLVVQSNGHLQNYSGIAYKKSLFPVGLSFSQLILE